MEPRADSGFDAAGQSHVPSQMRVGCYSRSALLVCGDVVIDEQLTPRCGWEREPPSGLCFGPPSVSGRSSPTEYFQMKIFRVSVSLAVFATNVLHAAAADTAARPNLVVVLVDDLRYDVFGYMDHRFVQTPQIDGLAAEAFLRSRKFG